jgi:hypothetical protein
VAVQPEVKPIYIHFLRSQPFQWFSEDVFSINLLARALLASVFSLLLTGQFF